MGRPSAIVSRRWRSRRSSPHRGRPGRTPMSSASSARSAGNASITSSSSMSGIYAVCCRHIFSITNIAGRISHSARIVQSLGPYRHRLQAPLSPSHRSAACTIATSVAQPELFAVTNLHRRRGAGRRRSPQLRLSDAGAISAYARRPGSQEHERSIRQPTIINHGLHRQTDSIRMTF